ncbi:MAG TPA: bacteriohemerythrin, partial [Terriglobales bacterium]
QAFRWNEAYAVNIASIDLQHQSLFATVNELNEALAAGHGADVTHSVLEKLIEYAATHFSAEESLMEEHLFPELYQHKVEHKRFTDRVVVLMARFNSKDSGVPGALQCFLENWLAQHVLTTDMAYSSYLNERGVH